MAQAHTVAITVRRSGLVLDTWDEYDIHIDMLDAGCPWALELYYSHERRSSWQTLLQDTAVRCGDEIILSIDGAEQFNGTVEEIDMDGSRASGAKMRLGGRSLAGRLIDFDADPRIEMSNTTLADAVQALVADYGIPVVVGADAAQARETQQTLRPSPHRRRWLPAGSRNKPEGARTKESIVTSGAGRSVVGRFHPTPGERVWSLIERISHNLGLLVWEAPCDGAIALIIDRPADSGPPVYTFTRQTNAPGAFHAMHGNILSGHRRVSVRGIPSVVEVYGAMSKADQRPARVMGRITNKDWADDLVTSPAPFGVFRHFRERANSQERAEAEARVTLARTMAGHDVTTVTVQGHTQSVNGVERVYAVNAIAHVTDTLTHQDRDMLVRAVSFKRSRAHGTTTVCTLLPLGAMQVLPGAK